MKIQWRIRALLLWYGLFRPKSKNNKLIKIGKSGRGSKNILFLLPTNKEQAQLASHLIKKSEGNQSIDFHYLVHEDGIKYYSKELKPQIMSYSSEDLNWLGAMNSIKILNKISNLKFDTLVDLSHSVEDRYLSLISLELDIPIKVGFQSAISEKLYTLVVEPSKDGFIEKNYETIERVLGL